MYSILNKEGRYGQIVHFLAETDNDLVLVTDACSPGSTIEVLSSGKEEEAGTDNIHTFIKTPSNRWALYKGKSEFEVPVNDAEVKAPEKTDKFGDQTAEDFQQGVTIYQTGLVTGTLKKASCEELYGSTQKDGHFFCATLNPPKEATKYGIYFSNEEEQDPQLKVDNWLMVRYENIPEKEPKTVKVVYDSGESFTFDLGYMDLQ